MSKPKDEPLFKQGDLVRYEGMTFTIEAAFFNESIGQFVYYLGRHDYQMLKMLTHSEVKDRVRKTSSSLL
ncbi:MAG: hypothetical protein O2840_00230 [bacterium]|nr:hypothetical protein [bacterium]